MLCIKYVITVSNVITVIGVIGVIITKITGYYRLLQEHSNICNLL